MKLVLEHEASLMCLKVRLSNLPYGTSVISYIKKVPL